MCCKATINQELIEVHADIKGNVSIIAQLLCDTFVAQ